MIPVVFEAAPGEGRHPEINPEVATLAVGPGVIPTGAGITDFPDMGGIGHIDIGMSGETVRRGDALGTTEIPAAGAATIVVLWIPGAIDRDQGALPGTVREAETVGPLLPGGERAEGAGEGLAGGGDKGGVEWRVTSGRGEGQRRESSLVTGHSPVATRWSLAETQARMTRPRRQARAKPARSRRSE